MTILETARLVRNISELLQQFRKPETAPKLADDYATVCHATNLRLQQCEAMLQAGDRLQTIQLAETAPNLFDLVTAVELYGSPTFQIEMGKRYMSGDGVETNLALARHWLQSACTNHESAASNLLERLLKSGGK